MSETSFSEGRLPLGSEVVKGFLAYTPATATAVSKSSGYNANASVFRVHSAESGAIEESVHDTSSVVRIDGEKETEDQMTRDEINAHLAKNKAEVDSVAAEMRREMAEWRTEQTQVLMSLKSEVTAINVKLDERFEAQKRSASLLQWLAGLILALVALIPAFQGMITDKKELQTQPIVVQIPQQPQSPTQK
ncbi:hypothetical protein ACOMDP_11845 [Pantoea dispersa]|uniref:hypothetical protein n=1 Tax=Pantoea dispersa TaxID=59814 RepID=UPI003B76BB7A